jgi:hypothetical protein
MHLLTHVVRPWSRHSLHHFKKQTRRLFIHIQIQNDFVTHIGAGFPSQHTVDCFNDECDWPLQLFKAAPNLKSFLTTCYHLTFLRKKGITSKQGWLPVALSVTAVVNLLFHTILVAGLRRGYVVTPAHEMSQVGTFRRSSTQSKNFHGWSRAISRVAEDLHIYDRWIGQTCISWSDRTSFIPSWNRWTYETSSVLLVRKCMASSKLLPSNWLYSILLVLPHMFGYLEQKRLGRFWRSFVFS